MLVAAEGLMRPEAWPFLLAYGAWLFWKQPRMRIWVVLGLVAQPVGWFGPPWISTGEALMAATHAQEFNGHLGTNWLATIVNRALTLQPVMALGFAGGAVALTLWRERDRYTLTLAAATLAWWLIVIAETGRGYPGLQRFLLPAAATACVLAGVGVVRVAAVLGQLISKAAGRVEFALVATAVAIVVFVAGGYLSLGQRVKFVRIQQVQAANTRLYLNELDVAVRKLGGTRKLLPCRASVVTVNHTMQPELAWELGTTLAPVQSRLRRPGVAFVAEWRPFSGGLLPPAPGLEPHRFLGKFGVWRVYQFWRSGPKPTCVGA
jgi:hypothetical protein